MGKPHTQRQKKYPARLPEKYPEEYLKKERERKNIKRKGRKVSGGNFG